MKRKLLALLLALAMTLALAACGGEEEPKKENDGQQTEDVTAPEETDKTEDAGDDADGTTDEAQEAPEEEEVSGTQKDDGGTETAEKPAEKPVEVVKPMEKPAEKPTTTTKPAEKPAETPAEKPAETKPAPDEEQSGTQKGVDLAAFAESLLSASQTDWPAMMPLEGESLDAFYAGLGDIAVNQCSVYTAMISAAVGEIALVEVQNADDVQKVKDIFQARVSYQVGDDQNPGGAWYPDSIEGWKNDSRIVSNGNFVMLVAFEGADSVVGAFNALFA